MVEVENRNFPSYFLMPGSTQSENDQMLALNFHLSLFADMLHVVFHFIPADFRGQTGNIGRECQDEYCCRKEFLCVCEKK